MSDDPTVSILGEEAVSAACYALANGQDLNRVPLEEVALTVLRAAASTVATSAEVVCTEGEECDPGAPEAYRLCDAHEAAQAHARGEHRWCDITCREAMGTEEMTNFVVAKGFPGTAGALRELLRRAAEDAANALAGREVPPPVFVLGDEAPSKVHVAIDRYAASPVPVGHPDYGNLVIYAVRRDHGWAVTDGAGWLANERGAWTLNSYDAQVFASGPDAKRAAARVAEEIHLRALRVLKSREG
jgi:hypothetical protein